MTATYDSSLPTDRDKVRLILSDTDTSNPIFQDEEIDAFLATYLTVNATAANLAEMLAARYANTPSISVDGYSVNYASQAAAYRSLAVQLRSAGLRGGVPITLTGVSISEMRDVASDPDRPADTVWPGMHQTYTPGSAFDPPEDELA